MKASVKTPLAGYIALAYTLVIVYASMQPFSGWRMPSPEVLGFLIAPWPRYVTAGDIALNIAAYLPLGAVLFFALRPPLAPALAFVIATFLAALLSLLLESAQMFLPTRIASNVDLLSNSAGAALGAAGAALLAVKHNPLAGLRARVVRPGPLGDYGLIVIALWVAIQFNPSSVAFGSGNLREVFGITPLFMHSSQAYLLGEAAVVALAAIVIALTISLLMQSRKYTLRVMLITLLLTAVAKSIAAMTITRAGNWLQWLTPGVAAGLVVGAAGVALLIWLAPFARSIAAIVCVAGALAVINFMPDNPYQTLPPFLSGLPPTHLANFGSMVRLLAQLWPFAALSLLIALARARPADGSR
jgi:VanZ family protein